MDRNAKIAVGAGCGVVAVAVVVGAIMLRTPTVTLTPQERAAQRAQAAAEASESARAAQAAKAAKQAAPILNATKLALALDDNPAAAARQYSGKSYRAVGRISDILTAYPTTTSPNGAITVWAGAGTPQFTCPVAKGVLETLHKHDWVIIYGTLSLSGNQVQIDACDLLWTGEKLPLTDAELGEAK